MRPVRTRLHVQAVARFILLPPICFFSTKLRCHHRSFSRAKCAQDVCSNTLHLQAECLQAGHEANKRSFFSSAADKVQRLGPESWTNINHSNKDKHNVQAVQKSVAVAKNKPNEKKRQTRTTRKSPSQICVSSQSRKQQNNSRPGPEPKQKKTQCHSATKAEREKPP